MTDDPSEAHARILEGLFGLSTVLTAINDDVNRAALLAGVTALREQKKEGEMARSDHPSPSASLPHAATTETTCHPFAHLVGCDCFANPTERNPMFPRSPVRIGAFDYAETSVGTFTRTDWRGEPSRVGVREILSRERLFDSLTLALTEAEKLASAIHAALACGDSTTVGTIRPALAAAVNAYERGR